jgi:hypothetical protein
VVWSLDNPASIPSHLLRALSAQRIGFERHRYFDHVVRHETINAIADELDRLVSKDRVVGYHCSKELTPDLFSSRGLRPLSINQHIEEFLEIVEVSAPQLLDQFRRVYTPWMRSAQMNGREGRVSFCLARELVVEEGTERFFKYYGGEALYWPFDKGNPCLDFLESLGRPVVVEVTLPARELSTFTRRPFARSLLGYYGHSINPEFQPEPLEAQMTRPILPSEIIRVHERDAFFCETVPAF